MAGPNTLTVTDQTFEDVVMKSAEPVLVDFWTETCPPCRMIAPVLDELATEYAGRAKVAKVNAHENIDLSVRFRINSVPAIFVIKNGQVIDQAVGARSKKDFKAMIDRAITA